MWADEALEVLEKYYEQTRDLLRGPYPLPALPHQFGRLILLQHLLLSLDLSTVGDISSSNF